MHRWIAVAVVSLAAACSTRPDTPALVVDSIDPASTLEGQSVAVQVEGQGFHAAIATDLDDGTSDSAGIAVTVGGAALDAMVLRGETLIEGTVPDTLAPGLYDVVVTAGEQSATLPGAFRVIQRCTMDEECDDGDPCTTNESCQDQQCTDAGRDKDADTDGFVDIQCGGDDCDDDDELENPNAVWFPDGDGDGYGDGSSGGSICERAAPTDVTNAEDCDDGDDTVYPGSSCDDGDSCTEVDTCSLGVCAGVDTCMSSCLPSCESGCGTEGCCVETCTGTCPNCTNDCSCDQTCTGTNCATTCSSDTQCRLTATADDASLSCAARSVCTLSCTGGNSCSMSCASDALCLVECGGATTCEINCSGGDTVDCGGGVLVCHRDCP